MLTSFLTTLLILLLVPPQILANTEFINFHVPLAPNRYTTQIDSNNTRYYRRLHAGNDQIILRDHHAPPCKDDDDDDECPHEIWLVLDIDSWSSTHYERFTLRVSWPASVRVSPSLFSHHFFVTFHAHIARRGRSAAPVPRGRTHAPRARAPVRLERPRAQQ